MSSTINSRVNKKKLFVGKTVEMALFVFVHKSSPDLYKINVHAQVPQNDTVCIFLSAKF